MSPAPTHIIRIGENDQNGTAIELDAVTAAALQRTGLVQVTVADPQRWLLQTCGSVGAVRVGDLEVTVTPKVGITRLLFLLGYATNPGFRPGEVSGADDVDLLPAVAETLCRHVERALGTGVLQGYQIRDEALTVIRGRLRLSDQFARHPGSLLPLEVTYDEYSRDIAENQILRAAIRRMRTVPRIPQGTRMRLAHLDGRLDGVRPLIPGSPLPRWQVTRLNHRYQPALRLAELVLAHQSVEVNSGSLPVAAFVVDMAKVFEDFVTTAFTEALKQRPGRTRAQLTKSLDRKDRVRIRPDIVHTVDDVPRIIIDAKYKMQEGGNNADYYQMLAYCTALNVAMGWLIYAQGDPAPAVAIIRNTGITVIAQPLDLTSPPKSLLEQIGLLANRAWENSDSRVAQVAM
jgi:5-methylcytosine-specific restriction enzyme subunit McrC